jgi:branched-chain amino acid transport system permease protein
VTITYAYKRFLEYLGMQPEGLVQLLSTEYKFAVSFMILVIVLLVRPTGIFRGRVL